jgi:hypothetical protein
VYAVFIREKFRSLPHELQLRIVEMATYHSPQTYRSLLLASRWSNSLTHGTTYITALTIRLTDRSKLESFADFLVSHPEQDGYIHRLFLCWQESEIEINAQLGILIKCQSSLESLSCPIKLFHSFIPRGLVFPNLRVLSVNVAMSSSNSTPDALSPKYSDNNPLLLPSLTVIHIYCSHAFMSLNHNFRLWPTATVRTLIFSSLLYEFLSLSASEIADNTRRSILSWMSLLVELQDVVCVCKDSGSAGGARVSCRETPMPFETAIMEILGHDIKFVSLDEDTPDELETGVSWKDELII